MVLNLFVDFEKFCKKQTDKIKIMFKMEEKPEIYSPKVIKFVDWWGEKFTPAILNIATLITTAWIFNYIQTKYGMEKLVVLIAIIFMFLLGGINTKLKILTDPNP